MCTYLLIICLILAAQQSSGLPTTITAVHPKTNEFVEDVKKSIPHWPMSVKSKYVTVIPKQIPEATKEAEEQEKNQLIQTRSTKTLPPVSPDLDTADYSLPFNRGKTISSDPADKSFQFPEIPPPEDSAIQEFRDSNGELDEDVLATRALAPSPLYIRSSEHNNLSQQPSIKEETNSIEPASQDENFVLDHLSVAKPENKFLPQNNIYTPLIGTPTISNEGINQSLRMQPDPSATADSSILEDPSKQKTMPISSLINEQADFKQIVQTGFEANQQSSTPQSTNSIPGDRTNQLSTLPSERGVTPPEHSNDSKPIQKGFSASGLKNQKFPDKSAITSSASSNDDNVSAGLSGALGSNTDFSALKILGNPGDLGQLNSDADVSNLDSAALATSDANSNVESANNLQDLPIPDVSNSIDREENRNSHFQFASSESITTDADAAKLSTDISTTQGGSSVLEFPDIPIVKPLKPNLPVNSVSSGITPSNTTPDPVVGLSISTAAGLQASPSSKIPDATNGMKSQNTQENTNPSDLENIGADRNSEVSNAELPAENKNFPVPETLHSTTDNLTKQNSLANGVSLGSTTTSTKSDSNAGLGVSGAPDTLDMPVSKIAGNTDGLTNQNHPINAVPSNLIPPIIHSDPTYSVNPASSGLTPPIISSNPSHPVSPASSVLTPPTNSSALAHPVNAITSDLTPPMISSGPAAEPGIGSATNSPNLPDLSTASNDNNPTNQKSPGDPASPLLTKADTDIDLLGGSSELSAEQQVSSVSKFPDSAADIIVKDNSSVNVKSSGLTVTDTGNHSSEGSGTNIATNLQIPGPESVSRTDEATKKNVYEDAKLIMDIASTKATGPEGNDDEIGADGQAKFPANSMNNLIKQHPAVKSSDLVPTHKSGNEQEMSSSQSVDQQGYAVPKPIIESVDSLDNQKLSASVASSSLTSITRDESSSGTVVGVSSNQKLNQEILKPNDRLADNLPSPNAIPSRVATVPETKNEDSAGLSKPLPENQRLLVPTSGQNIAVNQQLSEPEKNLADNRLSPNAIPSGVATVPETKNEDSAGLNKPLPENQRLPVPTSGQKTAINQQLSEPEKKLADNRLSPDAVPYRLITIPKTRNAEAHSAGLNKPLPENQTVPVPTSGQNTAINQQLSEPEKNLADNRLSQSAVPYRLITVPKTRNGETNSAGLNKPLAENQRLPVAATDQSIAFNQQLSEPENSLADNLVSPNAVPYHVATVPDPRRGDAHSPGLNRPLPENQSLLVAKPGQSSAVKQQLSKPENSLADNLVSPSAVSETKSGDAYSPGINKPLPENQKPLVSTSSQGATGNIPKLNSPLNHLPVVSKSVNSLIPPTKTIPSGDILTDASEVDLPGVDVPKETSTRAASSDDGIQSGLSELKEFETPAIKASAEIAAKEQVSALPNQEKIGLNNDQKLSNPTKGPEEIHKREDANDDIAASHANSEQKPAGTNANISANEIQENSKSGTKTNPLPVISANGDQMPSSARVQVEPATGVPERSATPPVNVHLIQNFTPDSGGHLGQNTTPLLHSQSNKDAASIPGVRPDNVKPDTQDAATQTGTQPLSHALFQTGNGPIAPTPALIQKIIRLAGLSHIPGKCVIVISRRPIPPPPFRPPPPRAGSFYPSRGIFDFRPPQNPRFTMPSQFFGPPPASPPVNSYFRPMMYQPPPPVNNPRPNYGPLSFLFR